MSDSLMSKSLLFGSRQVEKVAVHIVVGPLYKVLNNSLFYACYVFDVKMIQIWTFPAAPSTERVANQDHSINLRLINWRVPGLVPSHLCTEPGRRKSNVAKGEDKYQK